MNGKNTKVLFEKFSFFKPERPMTEALMCFGFEHDDGWFPIIWDLCEGLVKLDLPKGFEVIQVKEKYGSLRFYCNSEPKAVSDLIKVAEDLSAKTCERCGEPGVLRGTGWYRTECDRCAELRTSKTDCNNRGDLSVYDVMFGKGE